MKYIFLLLIPVYTFAAPPNAGFLMQNAKKQIQYQTQKKPIIKDTETIDEQLNPIKKIQEVDESNDDHNRSTAKQVKPKKNPFRFYQNSSATVALKNATLYSLPSDYGRFLGRKNKNEQLELDGCNKHEWCKVKSEEKYIRQFRLKITKSEQKKELKKKDLDEVKIASSSNVNKNQKTPQSAPIKKKTYEPKVLVKNFKITGNTILSTAMLESSLDSFKNKRLTFKQIQIAIGSISNKYRSEGYTARTLLPPQEVINGEIKVVVLEGNLSGIDIDSTDLQRFTPAQAKAIIENTHPVGEKLQTKNLERALLILGDTPGITSSASLVAGEKAGDSNLKLKLKDASLYDVFISYANGGAKSTGSDMLTISSSLNSHFSMGEQITLQGMVSEGIKYIGGGFSYPILYSGLKIGVDASAMRYEVVEDIEADGDAQTMGTWISYPIIRSPRTNLNITLKYDKKYYLNRVLETTVSDKNIQGLSLILDGSHYDSMGQTNIRATFSRSKYISCTKT